MEKYFSLALNCNGYCPAFSTAYKNDVLSRVFIVSDGTDAERQHFFSKLIKNLRGYSVSLFNPFYDDAPDGIYIKSINAYVLSNSGYSHISPALPEDWENHILISSPKNFHDSVRREILRYKSAENACYKKACDSLKNAERICERLHSETAQLLDDGKVINFLKRFCTRTFRGSQQGGGEVRLLSTPTPLGIHTHYDTLFDNYEKTVCFKDDTGFVSSVILGVIRDYAASEHIPFYLSPSYYSANIPQILMFPSLGLCLFAEDREHRLPFEAASTYTASRFLKATETDSFNNRKNTLLDIESKLLDTCVMHIFEGYEQRFEYRKITEEHSDISLAEKNADKLAEMIL